MTSARYARSAEGQPARAGRWPTNKLRDIQSLTDAALSSLEPQGLLDALVERIRQVLQADTAAVLLLDQSASFLVATAASGLEEEVDQGVRVPVGQGFAGRIAAEGRPLVLAEVDHTKVVNPLLLSKGIRSLMGAPLRAGETVLGVLHVGTLSPRAFSRDDVDLLQFAADRAALAVQTLTNQVDRAAAMALQRSLLPSALPAIPGLRMASRFVPGRGHVGGDWYDVFTLPSGQVCAMIGDVAGSGLWAAAIMGRMRSALRAYALETADPAEIISRLERKMAHFEPDAMATVQCAVFSPDLSSVRISSAGHLPPLLAVPGEATVVLPVPSDTLIGALGEPGRHRVTEINLPPGALLCLYTDGLVERRDRPIDDNIAHLAKAIKADDPETCCAAAMIAMAELSPSGDDVALLTLLRTTADLTAPASTAPAARLDLMNGPQVRWEGRRAVVTMPKEIDIMNAGGVRQFLEAVVAQSPEVVVADLTETVFCDSAGLNSLTRARRSLQASDRQLRLAVGESPVRRIIQLSGLDQVVPVFGSVDESLAAP